MKEINRVLTDEDRELYKPLIEDMFRVCPEMMSRKIPEANVQQAFVLSTVLGTGTKGKSILSVGCFEDTAYEYLSHSPIQAKTLLGIDPAVNYSLHSFVQYAGKYNSFDIVFATSTIEHVKNDEQFVFDMCSLLKYTGLGIITTDFKDDYRPGDPLPYSDERFYTRYDLEVRLNNVLQKGGCELLGDPDWTGKDNFIYQGHTYSFATFVFRKHV